MGSEIYLDKDAKSISVYDQKESICELEKHNKQWWFLSIQKVSFGNKYSVWILVLCAIEIGIIYINYVFDWIIWMSFGTNKHNCCKFIS